MGDFRKFAAALLLTVFAAGCTSTSVAPTDTQFVDGSPDAIVLVGMRSTMPIITNSGSGYPHFQMAWELLPAPGARRSEPYFLRVDSSDHDEMFGDSKPPSNISLHVVRVPAGTYYLRMVTTDAFESRYALQPAATMPGAPFFSVKPGEVRYIGDFHCDVISRPARCNTLTRNDPLAYAALSQYPGIRVRPQFRAPAYLPGGEEPAKVIPVASN